MRTMEIWVDNAEFSLNLKGFDCENKKHGKLVSQKMYDKYTFAVFKLTDDDKILGFFSIFVLDEILENAKDDPLFAEVCHFEAHTQRSETDIRHKNFDGSIYEALLWIKKEEDKLMEERHAN